MPRTPPRAEGSRTRTTADTHSPPGRPRSRGGARVSELRDAGAVYSQPEPLAPVARSSKGSAAGRSHGEAVDGSDARATPPSSLPARPRDFLNRRPNTASPCPEDEAEGARTLLGRLRSQGEHKIYGLQTFCNKVALGLALNFVAELFEDLMPWWPTTFILPRDMREATSTMHKKDKAGRPAHTFIFKPDTTFGGNGVCLVQSGEVLHALMQRKYSCAVLQEYLTRPLLIDGLKWDCRVYVLVTSISPLRVHVAREGLARFCTELYRRPSAENLEAMFSHVTNYALNKQSPAYQESEGDPTGGRGSKRSLSVVLERLTKLSRTFTTEQFWAEVDHIVAMTMLVLQPELIHKAEVRRQEAEAEGAEGPGSVPEGPSFHLLGFDILLDSNERASLLELNANPSLSTQSGGYNPITGRLEINTCAVDEAVKTAVVDAACSIIEQESAGGAAAETASAAPFHRLDVWQHPEYLRVRQLLQRLGRLLQYSLRGETSVGERDTGLGCARFQRFVRDAGLLSVRPERPKGGSVGTVIPALTPSIVDSMFKSVISSCGKTAVRSQLEYTKLGLLLRELARHQCSAQQRRARMPQQQPAVGLLEKSTKKLELLLGTADLSAATAAAEAAAAEKNAAAAAAATAAAAKRKQSDDPIEATAQSAINTLGRMSQLVQELEMRRGPRVESGEAQSTKMGGSLLPSPKRPSSQDRSQTTPLTREQRRRIGAAAAGTAAGISTDPAMNAEGSTTPLRLPRTPPGGTMMPKGGRVTQGRSATRPPAHNPNASRMGGVAANGNHLADSPHDDGYRRASRSSGGGSSGKRNSPPLGPADTGGSSPSHSEQRAEKRRQSRDDQLGAKRDKDERERRNASKQTAAREYYKGEYYKPTEKPHIKMERMTWSVPELDSAPLTNYSSIDRPPKRNDRSKERTKAANSAGGPPRWATSATSEMSFTTTTNAWRDRLMARGLS